MALDYLNGPIGRFIETGSTFANILREGAGDIGAVMVELRAGVNQEKIAMGASAQDHADFPRAMLAIMIAEQPAA